MPLKLASPHAPQTLEEKISIALRRLEHIASLYAPEEIAVAWTGGKDSTVALALWRKFLADAHSNSRPIVLNLDTGYKFPEVLAFRDELATAWSLAMTVLHPSVPSDYPVAINKVQCCHDLKVRPLQKGLVQHGIRVLITGVRADEHPDRAERSWQEEVSQPDHLRVHPVFDFTEMDIWAYTSSRNLPYCSLYSKGYRSLGCVPCTNLATCGGGERSGRDATKEASMETLHALGYF